MLVLFSKRAGLRLPYAYSRLFVAKTACYAVEMTATTTPVITPPRTLVALGLGAFSLLGLLYAVLGPALPTLSRQFALSAASASLLLSLNSAGAFVGVITAGVLSNRWQPQQRALLALVLIALGCVGLSFAASFPQALGAALLLGFGFGLLDLTINVWLSLSYGERSAAVLNLLSASFGVGAVLIPLATSLAGGDFRPPLLGCAALATVLLPLLLTMRPPPAAVIPPAARRNPARRSRALLVGFVLLFLTYVGVEGGVSAWEVTHLRGVLNLTTATAAQLTSLFWLSFTVGRLVSALLALRLEPAQLVIGSLALSTVSLALATLPAAAPAAYTLTGLFLAPVFTTGLVWLTRVLPTGGATTWVFASSFLGPVGFAPIIGAATDRFGSSAIPVTLLGITLLSLTVALSLRRALAKSV